MQRIPEPELMDEPAQVQAYAAADFSSSDQAMVDRLAALCDEDPGACLLDLGCGPGNISFRLARRWPGARVVGLDGAAAMLAVAEERLAREQDLRGRLSFLRALLPLTEPLPPALAERLAEAGRFTAVLSNSLLHHLHDPAALWSTLPRLAAPGCFVYLQDLRRPADPQALEGLVAAQMAAAPEVLCRDYRASLYAAFSPEEVAVQLAEAGLAGLRVAPLGERYLEVWGRLP
jgi:SAM-dependent methyltransferase